MAIPVIPFLIGAAVGAAITYIMKDEKMRDMLDRSTRNLADTAEDIGGELGQTLKQTTTRVVDTVEDATERVKGAVDDVTGNKPGL